MEYDGDIIPLMMMIKSQMCLAFEMLSQLLEFDIGGKVKTEALG